MEAVLVLILLVILGLLGVLIIRLNSFSAKPKDDSVSQLIHQQMESLRGQFVAQLGQINEQVSKLYADNQNIMQKVNSDLNLRMDNAARVIGDVHRKLGEVHETTKMVREVGKDISSLQEILRAPKIRGGMGELFLSQLLEQIFPKNYYELQYSFRSGEKVDAVIKLGDHLVPVDSKFPLESFIRMLGTEDPAKMQIEKKEFVRVVKKHIDDIAKKYILPDEGTFEFALMYIPAENVYYETIIKDENLSEEKGIFHYAIGRKVLPVSPNSFYAYLQTILLGLRGMKIEAQAQDILRNLTRLAGDFGKILEDFSKVGTHIKNLNAAYENTDKRLGRFGDKLESLEEKEPPVLLNS